MIQKNNVTKVNFSQSIASFTAVKDDSSSFFKVVIITKNKAFNVTLVDFNGKTYARVNNMCEPFDFTVHIFNLPKSILSKNMILFFSDDKNNCFETVLASENLVEVDKQSLIELYDSKIEIVDEQAFELTKGVSYKTLRCTNKNNAPVIAFAFIAKKGCCRFEAGTAYNGFNAHTQVQTVEEQALENIKAGKKVIGATNADFFDMFGDNAPSGLCVKEGIAIANPYSMRSFFGFTLNGDSVIGNFKDNPELFGQLYCAVGGREIFLKDGKINEFSPAEPFSYVCHPRTAVGTTKTGDTIILVVDGRIPSYSNGASIVDLARFMQKLGAESAINLDGGGSSTFLVWEKDKFKIKNRPADLFRPDEKLIRPIYNSLQIVID